MTLPLILLLTVSAAPVRAADAGPLTLAECLRLARAHSTALESARLTETGARGSVVEARGALKPQLLAVGQLTRSDDPATNLPNDNNAAMRLQQSLTPFSPGSADAARARADLGAAVLSRRDAELALALQVKTVYHAVVRDQAAQAAVDLVAAKMRELLDAVLPRFTVGQAPPFDLVKVRSSLADLDRTKDALTAQLAGEKSRLAQALGLAPDAPLALAPVSPAPLPEPAVLSADAEASPSLGALARRAEAADWAASAARRARLPSLVGTADYGWAGYTTSGMTRGWSLSVGMSLPVFDWGRIGAAAQRQDAAAKQARVDLEIQRREVRSALIEALAAARAHAADRERLAALSADARDAARAGVTRYRRGGAGILEATDSLALWLSTMLGENAAAHAYLDDVARVERLAPRNGGDFHE